MICKIFNFNSLKENWNVLQPIKLNLFHNTEQMCKALTMEYLIHFESAAQWVSSPSDLSQYINRIRINCDASKASDCHNNSGKFGVDRSGHISYYHF